MDTKTSPLDNVITPEELKAIHAKVEEQPIRLDLELHLDYCPPAINVIPENWISPATWEEIFKTRKLIEKNIYELPEYSLDPLFPIPHWIGSPPNEAVEKIRHKTIEQLAYYEWERAGRPDNMSDFFWKLGEKRFYDAFFCWM